MSSHQILALSSSKTGNSGYLEQAGPVISKFLNSKKFTLAFLPFAAADGEYDFYFQQVQEGLKNFDFQWKLAQPDDALNIVSNCDVIVVGGGNTFKLLHDLYDLRLLDVIKSRVDSGIPFIGWSAGANITGLTIGTTNDMPIIQPKSFQALQFFPFQINPHYYNQAIEGFNGESRDQRLQEFVMVNPQVPVIGLPEGGYLLKQNSELNYYGASPALVFHRNNGEKFTRQELPGGSDLQFLL
jgi:dipeptidase E